MLAWFLLACCVGAGMAAGERVEWGDRVKFLVEDMEESDLKTTLQACLDDASLTPFTHDFSIGHRGACLQYPEHTRESYVAAKYQGAGIVECDVAVTSDGELVCRHSQCDLHTTTNILAIPELAAKCEVPFTPANDTAPATARCCTSDITLEEFKSLCGKMDASDSSATTIEEYLGGTAAWRTELYATCATVVSHNESIALIGDLKFTPELKTYVPGPGMPSYDAIRAKLVEEYVQNGVDASRVWPQSFNLPDIEYWIANYPDSFGPQAVYLDGNYCDGTLADCPQTAEFDAWYDAGVRYYAPPVHMLASAKAGDSNYAATELAAAARDANLTLITWTVERSGPLVLGETGFYYGTSVNYTDNDGDVFEYIHALSEAGVVGIFSDWPATTTFYADCLITVDSASWHKTDDPSKDCAWVAAKPDTRCLARANDKSFAFAACARTCEEYATS